MGTTTASKSDFIRRRDVWIKKVIESPDIRPGYKVALIRFAFHADNETGEAYVSNATLGTECGGVSAQTVSRAMSAGIREGFILERSRGGTATGKRLTSVRKCVFPVGQTLVQTDIGTSDPSPIGHGPMSKPTMTHVQTDMDPSQNGHSTYVQTDYPTNPLTKPLTKQDNSASELTGDARADSTDTAVDADAGNENEEDDLTDSQEPVTEHLSLDEAMEADMANGQPDTSGDSMYDDPDFIEWMEQQKAESDSDRINRMKAERRSGNRTSGAEKIPEKTGRSAPGWGQERVSERESDSSRSADDPWNYVPPVEDGDSPPF